jgi:hypothetical protein
MASDPRVAPINMGVGMKPTIRILGTGPRQIDRPVVDGYDAIFRRAIAAGDVHDDFAALSQFLGKPGGK